MAQWLTNPTRNCDVLGSIPGLAQWGKDLALPVSFGVGCTHHLYPELLWLWRRPAAVASIRLLAWEPPYAAGMALEKTKKTKKKNKKPYIYIYILFFYKFFSLMVITEY